MKSTSKPSWLFISIGRRGIADQGSPAGRRRSNPISGCSVGYRAVAPLALAQIGLLADGWLNLNHPNLREFVSLHAATFGRLLQTSKPSKAEEERALLHLQITSVPHCHYVCMWSLECPFFRRETSDSLVRLVRMFCNQRWPCIN